MNWVRAFVVLCCLYTCESNKDASTSYAISTTSTPEPQISEEDLRIVNESINKYGPVHDFRELGLPGPEIVPVIKDTIEDEYTFDNVGNYTLRIRRLTPLFVYNRRYEVGIDTKYGADSSIIKGQFSEHFRRESGGLYLRTIGYILDENGYRQFLLDISKGEYVSTMKRISSAAIASLTGGGLG